MMRYVLFGCLLLMASVGTVGCGGNGKETPPPNTGKTPDIQDHGRPQTAPAPKPPPP